MAKVSLILLPGMDGTGQLFEPLVSALAGEFEIKVVTYPTSTPLGYSELEAIAREAIPKEGSYVILGESFSGPIAIALAGFHFGTRYGTPVVAPTATVATDNSAMQRELADLRAKVDSVGQLVGYSLLQQRTTSERLQTVLTTLDDKNPNQRILANLIGALALDPSVNVRLSALDALFPHAEQQLVSSGVLASLPREQNPLVQVAMIDFLVAARDRDATPELEKIARD